MKNVVAACIVALALVAPAAQAQDNAAAVADLQTLQKAARADKRALVAKTLDLSATEGKRFWPIYDKLQADLANLNRQRNVALETLVNRDRPVTDAYAKQLVNDLMSLEEQEIKAMRKAANASLRALPPRKAARYMQLEQKLRAVQDYEIAIAFPLAQ
jgi:hypothetical protein